MSNHWTLAEDQTARQMLAIGHSLTEIGKRLGRCRSVVCRKMKQPPMTVDGRRYLAVNRGGATFVIPARVIEERDVRLAVSPSNLTAAFFGDPLPGYSALDRRYG
jgi:hypothetical protein